MPVVCATVMLSVFQKKWSLLKEGGVLDSLENHGSKRLHLKMCEIDNGNFID